MSYKRYILSIDQGTTGTTVILLDENFKVVARCTREFRQIFPEQGWVEHSPQDIYNSVLQAISVVLNDAKIKGKEIEAIAITNQRETVCFLDVETKKSLYNAIVWQCRRTESICNDFKKHGLEDIIKEKTGLLLDPYFSATKIKWALENVQDIQEAYKRGTLRVGTIDSFLVFRLTDGTCFRTDTTNASRTMLFNIHSLEWDSELCELFGIHERILPEVRPSMSLFGTTKNVGILPDGIPIVAIAGDQQAALFGQFCHRGGEAKCTYGTGAFLLLNTGEKPLKSKFYLLTTIAITTDEYTHYALEGSCFIAGAAVQWLRDELKFINNSSEVEDLAKKSKDSAGLVFVPSFVGLGAPYWKADVAGLLYGIRRNTNRSQIARAVLEGIVLQVTDLLNSMQKDFGSNITLLKVDGGASANNLMMQLQADLLGIEVRRPKNLESTALGVAMMAGIYSGIYNDIDQLHELSGIDRIFKPEPSDYTDRLKRNWHKIINMLLSLE